MQSRARAINLHEGSHVKSLTLLVNEFFQNGTIPAESIFTKQEIDAIKYAIKSNNHKELENVIIESWDKGSLSIHDHYNQLCSNVLKINGLYLQYIFEECFDDIELVPLYFNATHQNGLALEYVPKTHPSYYDIALAAIQQDPVAVQFISRSFSERRKLYKQAVQINGLVLEYIFDAQDDPDICLAAINENIFALEFVDFDTLDIDKMLNTSDQKGIIEQNYVAQQYFPKTEVLQEYLDVLLQNVEHVIVFNKKDLNDRELEDCKIIYRQPTKRKNKTICVDIGSLEKLLNDIEVARGDHANNKINLILLGHANVRSVKIIGLDPEEITPILRKHPIIGRVVIFGCRSAQAEKLEEEINIMRSIKGQKNSEQPLKKCGLLLLDKEKFKSPEKMLRAAALEATYIILNTVTDEGGQGYKLMYIEKNPDTGCKVIDYSFIRDEDIKKLENTFTAQSSFTKSLETIQKKRMTVSTLVSAKKPLTDKQLEIIHQVAQIDKSDRSHPQYKSFKENCPYLRNFVIGEPESEAKLKDCLLKKLITAIKTDKMIKQALLVKAYSDIICVDNKLKQFHVTPILIYTKNYYKHRLYQANTRVDNIDRKLLVQERLRMNAEIDSDNYQSGDTLAKSITVQINPSTNNNVNNCLRVSSKKM